MPLKGMLKNSLVSLLIMTTLMQFYIILIVYSRVHFTFTLEPPSNFDMGSAPTMLTFT